MEAKWWDQGVSVDTSKKRLQAPNPISGLGAFFLGPLLDSTIQTWYDNKIRRTYGCSLTAKRQLPNLLDVGSNPTVRAKQLKIAKDSTGTHLWIHNQEQTLPTMNLPECGGEEGLDYHKRRIAESLTKLAGSTRSHSTLRIEQGN